MANNANDCNSDLPFHQCYAPKSMQWYDLEALDKNEQTNLNKYKLQTIRDNVKYLNEHPEITVIIQLLIEEILEKQPQNNLHEFAAEYFSQPKFDLFTKIQYRLEQKAKLRRNNDNMSSSTEDFLKKWINNDDPNEMTDYLNSGNN